MISTCIERMSSGEGCPLRGVPLWQFFAPDFSTCSGSRSIKNERLQAKDVTKGWTESFSILSSNRELSSMNKKLCVVTPVLTGIKYL